MGFKRSRQEILIEILELLIRRGPQRLTWVSIRCNLTHQTTTDLLFSLVTSGLAEKVERESGIYYVATEKGRNWYKRWVDLTSELFLPEGRGKNRR
jgi:predicted transcriptional regulator